MISLPWSVDLFEFEKWPVEGGGRWFWSDGASSSESFQILLHYTVTLLLRQVIEAGAFSLNKNGSFGEREKKTYIYALPERHPDLSAPSASSDLNGGFADYYNPSHQYCNLQFTCYSELVPVIALFDYRSWFPCRGWAHQTLRVILVRAPRNVLKFPCTWIGTTTGQWVILTRDRTVLVGCCGSFVTACVVTFTAITEGAVCKEMIQSEKCTENQYVLLTCDLSAWRLGAMGFSGCGGNVYCCLGGGGGSKRSALVLSPLGLFRAFSEVVRWDFVRRLS